MYYMYFWKPLLWLLDHHTRGYLERWWRWGGGRWWRKRMNSDRWERNTCAPCIIIEYQFIVMIIIIITSIQPLFIRTGTVTSASLGAWRIFQTFIPTLAKKKTIISKFYFQLPNLLLWKRNSYSYTYWWKLSKQS